METTIQAGYSRKLSPELLELAEAATGLKDELVNDISLSQSLLATLRIEKNRLTSDTRMLAQNDREALMKRQFLAHFRAGANSASTGKTLFRFGRNHLHRGYDARGISTLGNFAAEFAITQGLSVFNVGCFGAGGKATLMGKTFDADERRDELAFALLAQKAKYPVAIFDLKAIRPALHRIPSEKRSELESNLLYWADAYDAIICYQTVTPVHSQAR